MSRGNVLVIGTGYGLDDRGVGVRVPVGPRIFTSPYRPDRLWGPLNLISNGYGGGGFFLQGREADHSPPTSAEVEKSQENRRQWTVPYIILVILSAALGLGVHSACNGSENQKQKNNVSGE
jgi:hypothetical protein